MMTVSRIAVVLGLVATAPDFVAQFARTPDTPLAAGAARAVAESAAVVLDRLYVDPTVAAGYARTLRRHVAANRYDTVQTTHALARLLTADLTVFHRDGHLEVLPVRERQAAGQPDTATVAARRRRWNGGFVKVEQLPGNVGYLKLDGFAHPEHGARAADAAFAFLQDTDALIIDLRDNTGGEPRMVAHLVTRLLPIDRVALLNTIWKRGDSVPRQYWTVDGLAGPRYLKPVYLLMASHTVSAPEELAYDLRVLQRATVVGERSGGGANPGRIVAIGHGLGVFVSTERAVHPVTGTNWEGVGIAPDVAVSASEALATAHRLALEAVLATATDPVHQRELRRVLSASTARTP
jgi:retinol-binding protein 3